MNDGYRNFIDTSRPTDSKRSPVVLTERDTRIFEHIYAYGGVLGQRHILELEFPGTNGRTCQDRLSRLYHDGWLTRTTSAGARYCGEMVYWLTTKSADNIQKSDFLPFPVWKQIRHDLLMVDFLFYFQKACVLHPQFSLYEWIDERQLRSTAVSIDFVQLNGRSGRHKVVPDGFVTIDRTEPNGERLRSRLIIEMDLSTHPNKRFADDKVLPGLAWIRSEVYKRQFGLGDVKKGFGRFLVITKSEERLKYLKATTENAAGRDGIIWYFTTLSNLSEQSILTEPIWNRAGGDNEPVPLFREI